MREGWTYKKFEDCLVKAPKAKQVQTSQYNTGSKYPIVSQEDTLISGFFDDDAYLYHIDNPIVVFGDHTRVLKYIDFDFVVGADGVKILIPKEFLNAKLLYYYLLWYKIPNLGYSRHYKLLKEIDIPIPSLSEQQSIVAELDKINELISLKKAQLSDLDSLAQSIFYDMFGDPVTNEKGWEKKKYEDICLIITDGEHSTPKRESIGVFLLSARNIHNHRLELQDVDYIGEDEYNRVSKRIIPQAKDILISCSGSVGRVCSVPDDLKFQMVRSVALLRLKSHMNNVFFEYLISSDFTQEQINKAKTNSAQANLFQGRIKKLIAIIPPLTLQQEFAKRIELIEQQKAQISSTIKDLETLLASRMQYWFD